MGRLVQAVAELDCIEEQPGAVAPQASQRLLPEKAEIALREAGLWDEQFVRRLAHLDRVTLDALGVIGAWDDLDWEEMSAAFTRLRHENPPSPPIEL